MFRALMLAWARVRRNAYCVAVILLILAVPERTWACACGCSVFDIGGTSGLPIENDHGGRVFLEWDYSNQNRNWSGTSGAPAANSSDKRVLTDWFRLGFQYMFNREWGVMATLPYANRTFTTDNNPPGPFNTYHVSDLADMEIMGMYTGFSKDMSTGLIFGLKLPTGNYTAPGFDRDTQQLFGSHREPDSGTSAFPDDTGFHRLMISPGVEFTYVLDNPNNKAIRVYGDVEIPIYQRVNGNQLVAPALFKVIASYTF